MLDKQPGPVALSQRRRIMIGFDGKLGKIYQAKDTFDFD
jgi:hypothetical protein